MIDPADYYKEYLDSRNAAARIVAPGVVLFHATENLSMTVDIDRRDPSYLCILCALPTQDTPAEELHQACANLNGETKCTSAWTEGNTLIVAFQTLLDAVTGLPTFVDMDRVFSRGVQTLIHAADRVAVELTLAGIARATAGSNPSTTDPLGQGFIPCPQRGTHERLVDCWMCWSDVHRGAITPGQALAPAAPQANPSYDLGISA